MITKKLIVRPLTIAMALLFIHTLVQAQSNIGIGTPTPHPSAALDVSSSTQGMLVPRMSLAQRNLIASPAVGLIVYQNDNTPGYYYYNGGAWVNFMGATGVQGADGPQGITGQAGNAGAAGVSVPVGGSAGQVLAKINTTDYNMEWVTPSTSGVGSKLVWEGIATVTQTVPVGSPTTAPSIIIFDNDVTGPTNAGTITNDSVFVVGEAGLYCITAHVIAFQSSSSGLGAAPYPYIEIKNAVGGNNRQYFGMGVTSSFTTGNSSALQFQWRGRSFATAWVQLVAGETVRIKVNNQSTSVPAQITTDGTTRISIVKY